MLLYSLAANDGRIIIINLDKNIGPAGARNEAIKISNGRYLAFLDSDDLWLSNKLQCQINFMAKNSIALSYTDYRFMSEDGSKVGRLLSGPKKVGWVAHHMTRYLGCLTIMVDKQRHPDFAFPAVSKEDFFEDFLAWSEIIKSTGPAYRCPYDLARYAVVKNSRSSNPLRTAKSVWRLYREKENISLFPALFYFSSYVIFTLLKRYFYSPIYSSGGNL
jgi:teichuronic acid biosynthesis glycosyltransferase TuaG